MAALACLTGVGPEFLRCRWPDDRVVLQAIIERADALEADRRKDLAIRVGNRVGEIVGKMLG